MPRTGSTLLGSILNQNPDVHVSPTSPLYPLLVGTNATLNALSVQHTFDQEVVGDRIYPYLATAFYPDNCRQSMIFDKHRGWPKHIDAILKYINDKPRIIATVRPIAEIITSYIVLAERDPNNFIDRHLTKDGIEISNESRAMCLWEHYLNNVDGPVEALRIGLNAHPELIMLIDYDRLCCSPHDVLRDIYSFCGMKQFDHDFQNIDGTCEEAKDEAWGMNGLHDIRCNLGKTSVDPLSVLPQEAIDWFSQFDISVVNCG